MTAMQNEVETSTPAGTDRCRIPLLQGDNPKLAAAKTKLIAARAECEACEAAGGDNALARRLRLRYEVALRRVLELRLVELAHRRSSINAHLEFLMLDEIDTRQRLTELNQGV